MKKEAEKNAKSNDVIHGFLNEIQLNYEIFVNLPRTSANYLRKFRSNFSDLVPTLTALWMTLTGKVLTGWFSFWGSG